MNPMARRAYSFRLRTHLGINDSNCGSKAAMNAVEAELCINPVVYAEGFRGLRAHRPCCHRGLALLTRDATCYRTYYPKFELICP